MDNHSPHSSGVCLCHGFKLTVDSTVPGAKRLLDSSAQVQALQSAKKACVLSRDCSTPDPARELLCSPGPACFQGSPCFLDVADHNNLVASSSTSKYDDVVISLDTSRCFDGSEPDDALLELSDGEEGNSPFNFTEEEIQEILADDCVESEQHLTRETALSQNVDGESENNESSRSNGAATIREGVNTENPKEPLSRESSSVSSEGYPSLLSESAGLDGNLLQSTQVTDMFFDLDIQELLNLSPVDAADVDELLEDNCLEEAEKEALGTVSNDKAAHSCDLEASLEELMSNGWQSLRKTPVTSSPVPDSCGDGGGRCVPSADHSPAEDGSVPLVLMCSTPFSVSESQELPKASKSCLSRKLSFPEGDEGDSAEAEQPSNSMESGDRARGQIEQEEATSGKEPGKVIPVPQEEEESLKQWTCTLEAEFEPLYPECAHLYEESCSSCNSLIQEPSTAEGERKVFVKSRDPAWAEPQSCIPLGPF
ncbi:S100P-binding protein isoform X2 [Melopsittacus undulatus]|uniref:S100P-binding protein isoform X2 n=1 Tax=Melopsittacus undulatus TaxID=13146 RepID=UPI00146C3890|nr:S100P-binding protein isoform X2 [Melopsittacus undulatus]